MTTNKPDIMEIYKKSRDPPPIRAEQELYDACRKEYRASLDCLHTNNYDKNACTTHFTNYKLCRQFWSKVSKDRWWKGIRPCLPLPEERDEIKAAYKEKMKTS